MSTHKDNETNREIEIDTQIDREGKKKKRIKQTDRHIV